MDEPTTASLLDGEFIAQRRNELGMSQAELARKLGVGPIGVRRLEEGATPFLSIGQLAVLARELDTTVSHLWQNGRHSAPSTTTELKVEALLLTARRRLTTPEIQTALDLPRADVVKAVDQLERRLSGTGATLLRSNGRYRIGPRDGILDRREQTRLAQARRARTELRSSEARYLREVMLGAFGPERRTRGFGGAARAAIGALLTNELIVETSDGALKLAPAVEYSLGLRRSRASRSPAQSKRHRKT